MDGQPELAGLSSPKAYATDPGIERTRQIIAKSNQANIALHNIPELDFPAIAFADEVAEGPVMILDLWSQFDCEIMIAVCPRRAFCSLPTARAPQQHHCVRPILPASGYSVIDHATVFNEELPCQSAPLDRVFKRFHEGVTFLLQSVARAVSLGPGLSDWLISCSTKAFQTRSDILSNFSFMSRGMKIPFFST